MKIIMKPVRIKDLYPNRKLDGRENYFIHDWRLTGSVYSRQGKSYTPHLTKYDLIKKLSSKLGMKELDVLNTYSDKIDKSYLIHLDNYIKAYIVDRGILHYSVNGHDGNRCSNLVPDFNNTAYNKIHNELEYDKLIFVTDEHYAFIPIPVDLYDDYFSQKYESFPFGAISSTPFRHDGNYEDMYKRMIEIGKIEVDFYDKNNNISTKTIHIKDFRLKEDINTTKWKVDSDGNKYYKYKK